ncbi:MAG: methyltransferase [Candidatus Zixiibacteriota bacterium]|nr:MAG: methyltransferase [candidate division Zixibacteria bacterium]
MKTSAQLKEDISFEVTLRKHRLQFRSTWGLFSPRCIDDGSYLLIEHIDVEDGQQTLDLGCGYGAMGLAIAKECPAGNVHLVDKDFVAVDYAIRNAELNGLGNCRAYLSNAFSAVGNTMFDNIAANLPAKVGNELLYIMLCDARDHLNPGGQLVVVTVSGIRQFIKRNFKEVFGNYRKLKQGREYTVARAFKEDTAS